MKKYILYAHDGSGNHGCEALVRSTVELLGVGREQAVLVSERPEEDIRYGLDQLCTLVKRGTHGPISRTDPAFIKSYLQLKLKKDYHPMDRLAELRGAGARPGDIALSIGGDVYCYGGTALLEEKHTMWKSGDLKTVYWGCSIEPQLLNNPKIAADIKRYDLITARETISYEALKKVNANTVLVSDSAFHLKCKKVALPTNFQGYDVVGINSSPLVERSEATPGMARINYEKLIEYILETTKMKILLVPHVIWEHDDDRKVLAELMEKYKGTDRIIMIEDCNCEILKGYISQCRFFVGARTHASIAAYSMGVPTLVVGYSVKSRGIARDIFGTEENYVVPVQQMTAEDDLVHAFAWMQHHETDIRQTLNMVIPEYKNRIFAGFDALRKL